MSLVRRKRFKLKIDKMYSSFEKSNIRLFALIANLNESESKTANWWISFMANKNLILR